jgi:hypothetical protein
MTEACERREKSRVEGRIMIKTAESEHDYYYFG